MGMNQSSAAAWCKPQEQQEVSVAADLPDDSCTLQAGGYMSMSLSA